MAKRPKVPPKQRKLSIKIKSRASFNQIRFDMRTGAVETLMDGERVDGIERSSTVISYDRPAKPKFLTAIPNPGTRHLMTPYSFVDLFDVVFAVDTNTRELLGERHSIAAMSMLEIERSAGWRGPGQGVPGTASLSMNMLGCLIRGKNCPGNPEPWFWRVAIEDGIKKSYAKYSESLRIGLVVDSELGSLDEYNARTKPIHGDYFLPDNVSLIYASSDTGSSTSVLNRLIRYCDAEAEYHLDRMAKGLPASNTIHTKMTGMNEHCEIPDRPFGF